ncbi:cytosine-purine permease [Moniliophthora roreri]|nr:cytosine-purine permease [Moniliophthora roreri]
MAPAVLSGRKRNLWNKLVDIIQVPQGQFVFEGNRWGNHDLDPTPPEERKWTAWLYASFWAAHAANASLMGASLLDVTLDFWSSREYPGIIWNGVNTFYAG